MEVTPIDLKAEFGDRYRIASEETRQPGQHWDPWLAQMRCKYGHVYVHGDEELGVAVDSGRVKIAGTIRRLNRVRVVQDGDDGEVNAVFHRRHLDAVLEIMKPYRVWHYSEEERERRRHRLAEIQKRREAGPTANPRRQEAVSA